MSTVLDRWKTQLAGFEAAERAAKSDHTQKQAALEKARAVDLHPRAALVIARDRATAKLTQARRDEAYAKRVIARHSHVAVDPERTLISPNKSSRGGVKPRLIVLHITVSKNLAGIGDVEGLLNYAHTTASQISFHVVNDAEGNDGRCVYDADKAWTCAAYNPLSLNVEQIEPAAKSRERWLSENRPQLLNSALWVANWSLKYGIPIVHSTSKGVCQHMELGAAGGGHTDCGPGYPLDYVLAQAKKIKPTLELAA